MQCCHHPSLSVKIPSAVGLTDIDLAYLMSERRVCRHLWNRQTCVYGEYVECIVIHPTVAPPPQINNLFTVPVDRQRRLTANF
jgi:hypothetical protein